MNTSVPDDRVWRGVLLIEDTDDAGKKTEYQWCSRPYDTKGPAKRWVTSQKGNVPRYGKVLDVWIEHSTGWERFDD